MLSLLDEQGPSMEELLEGAALDPPTGQMSDFAHPGGSHTLGYATIITGAVLSTIAVLMRLGSRYALRKAHYEDAFLVIALAFFVAYIQTIYDTSIFPGVQVHQWNIQLKTLKHWQYQTHLASIYYGLSILFLKLAILVDWLRIFLTPGQRNFIFWSIHFLIWSNAIYYISGTFLEIFQCFPQQKIWDPLFVGGFCTVDIEANNFVSAILNLVSDLLILAVPQFVVWKLNMSRRRKVGISFIFGIGIFAIAAGIARLVDLLKILDSNDAFYYVTEVGLWGIGEMTAGFLIIGIPASPRAMKSLPFSGSVVSLFHSLTRSNNVPSSGGGGHSYLQSWRRPLSRKRRGLWEISELETGFDLDNVGTPPQHGNPPAGAIAREVRVEVGDEPNPRSKGPTHSLTSV
ncbi:hypothetical protein F4808DRAFT_293191 [Astrocystis sublimbata]|nr:hypothetical protein F4808DRAFT_293191 [Astrocystis sublimbata]